MKKHLLFLFILMLIGYGVVVTILYCGAERRLSIRDEGYYKQRDAVYEELLFDLDSEYGAEYRDEAVRLFNQLAAEGKVPKGNPAKATRIMERCYKEAKATQPQPSKYMSRLNKAYVDSLMADEHPDSPKPSRKSRGIVDELLDEQENPTSFSSQKYYNVDDFDSDGLQIDAYGPGIHMNRYGQPVRLRPDFGGVEGERLQIQPNAYGPGVHMDQYGRPVREYP